MKAFVLLFFFIVISFSGIHPLYADVASTNTEQEISQDSLQNMIDSISSRQDLGETQKSNALKHYQAAKENLRTDEWYQFLTNTFQQSIKDNPEKIQSEQQKIDKLQKTNGKDPILKFDPLSIADMEQQQVVGKTQLNTIDIQIAKISQEIEAQELRLEEIRQQTDLAKQKLEEAKQSLSQIAQIKGTPLEQQGRKLELNTLINQLTTEIKMLGVEAISHPSRLQLLKTQQQHLDLQRQKLLPEMTELEKTLASSRQQEAETLQEQLLQAEKDSVNKHLAIQIVTRENTTYSRTLQELVGKIEFSNSKVEALTTKRIEIESDFKSAEKKISLAGLSPALGKILREQRRQLNTQTKLSKQGRFIQNETAVTSLEQFKAETQLKEQSNLEEKIEKLLEPSKKTLNEKQLKIIKTELEQLLLTNNQLLEKLIKNYTVYLRSLSDYDFEKQQLLKQAEQYAHYLDKRLLWVPSSAAIGSEYFADIIKASRWLFAPDNWKLVFHDLLRMLGKQVILSGLVLLLLTILVFFMAKIEQKICDLRELVNRVYSDQFRYTLKALLYTLVSILSVPFWLFFTGWLLTSDTYVTSFSFAVGKGLQDSAVPLFFISFFHRLFAPCGIVKEHFNWTEAAVKTIHRQTNWLRFAAPIATFILVSSDYSNVSQHADSIGRFAVIVSMLFMSIALSNILNPNKPLVLMFFESNPEGWVAKFRYLWFLLSIIVPFIVIGFAVAGYYLSAVELQQKLIASLRLVFTFIIIHQIVLRWLNLAERQLALKNARQRRETIHRTDSSEATSLSPEELLVDIPKVNEQSTKVLKITIGLSLAISLWVVWRDIFPAFSFLDNVVLWQNLEIVENKEILQATTLTDLLLALLYLFVMISAVINFPGVMEVFVFSRWAIEPGSRYAANQLIRYFLVAIGVIVIANQMGGNWSQVQWLIAALSVGLGFGLQEIFANLVSGIILLSERPIRIGDTVTVGDVTGKVSRIQMRATHIMDWDKKELVIPNKMFITDRLINWTLSDPVTRIVIPLGIAYGSDVELAQKVITETVINTEFVLKDPEPSVLFIEFGDSSLNFSIRIYVADLGQRLTVTHDLHMRLNKALAKHHIEIPFPQRDIHIRSDSTKS